MGKLTHVDDSGQPAMVDVGDKAVTRRTAVAESRVRFPLTVEKRAPLSSGTPGEGFGQGAGDSRAVSSAPEPIRGAVALVRSESWRAEDDPRALASPGD